MQWADDNGMVFSFSSEAINTPDGQNHGNIPDLVMRVEPFSTAIANDNFHNVGELLTCILK